ncbi:hypothetical protein [Enterobacter hormaechei]|uniref:hypothetical protein n=1 Tax=Enterobacter hormaechei TaxID=158836 RepID=UPI0013DE13DD|nr:hypothetical protein [Enterobacter hormaechei]EKK5437094.1 hypothetical protein [Enterobacter hormaechei]MCF3452887.1 hypothetical protein [Enterobacter hormaechei]MCK1021762.1 hypothetical protein [Enterobacter hormaechei subsp. xiangfangensis]MCM7864431.1 hypothetical protein [Enterobacter hormaechei]QIF25210.1 hypothetical protein G5C52_02410 [Enterobacter hormaechei]
MKKQVIGLCFIALSPCANAQTADNSPIQDVYKCEQGYVYTFTSDNYETFYATQVSQNGNIIAQWRNNSGGMAQVNTPEGGTIFESFALGQDKLFRLIEGYYKYPVLSVLGQTTGKVEAIYKCKNLLL